MCHATLVGNWEREHFEGKKMKKSTKESYFQSALSTFGVYLLIPQILNYELGPLKSAFKTT